MRFSPWPAIAGLAVFACLAVSCLTPTGAVLQGPPLSAPGDKGDRTTCEDILGTAFRSESERTWFLENCSTWPLVNVDQSAVQYVTTPPESPECAQARGRPYESEEQRRWFQANCNGQNNPASSTPAPQPSAGPDRTDCNQIRGTAYSSAAERAWFQANCGQPSVTPTSPRPTQPPAPTQPPTPTQPLATATPPPQPTQERRSQNNEKDDTPTAQPSRTSQPGNSGPNRNNRGSN